MGIFKFDMRLSRTVKAIEWVALMGLAARVGQLEASIQKNEKPLSQQEIAELKTMPWLISGVIPENYTKTYKKICKKYRKDILSILKKDKCEHDFPKDLDDDWKYKDCTKCGLRLFFNGYVAHNDNYYSYWEIIEKNKQRNDTDYLEMCKARRELVGLFYTKRGGCNHTFPRVSNNDWDYLDCIECGLRLFFNGTAIINDKKYSYDEILHEFKIMMNEDK